MEYYQISIANFLDKTESENEDAIHVKSLGNHNVFVLCDGAGGSGVFSKEWAEYLAKSIPLKPEEFDIENGFSFNKICNSFYEEVLDKQDLSDLFLNKKLHRDGSYSTLSICWIDELSKEITISSIGDSCCFYFEIESDGGFKLKKLTSINEQESFFSHPHLVNWNYTTPPKFLKERFVLSGSFVVIMASDSLAKWMISCIYILQNDFFNEKNFNISFLKSLEDLRFKNTIDLIEKNLDKNPHSLNNLIKGISQMAKDKNIFETEMKQKFYNHELEIDDYSLLIIGGDVSK